MVNLCNMGQVSYMNVYLDIDRLGISYAYIGLVFIGWGSCCFYFVHIQPSIDGEPPAPAVPGSDMPEGTGWTEGGASHLPTDTTHSVPTVTKRCE